MFGLLKRLFCVHKFDYESDIFIQIECRKCGKVKNQQLQLFNIKKLTDL